MYTLDFAYTSWGDVDMVDAGADADVEASADGDRSAARFTLTRSVSDPELVVVIPSWSWSWSWTALRVPLSSLSLPLPARPPGILARSARLKQKRLLATGLVEADGDRYIPCDAAAAAEYALLS